MSTSSRTGAFRAMAALVVAGLASALLTVPSTSANFSATTDNVNNSMVADTLDPPSDLAAVDGVSVSLSWTATPDTTADGHRVYRSTSPGGPYTQIAEITPRTTVTYVDSPGPGDYYYVVRAFDGAWVSVDSNEASATVVSAYAYVSLDGGLGHSCGSRVDGSLWCWGRNDKGQLGFDSGGADVDIPTEVYASGLDEVVTGTLHSCGVKADETVWCWGDNPKGQLGDGTTAGSTVPVQVVGAGGVGTLTGVATAAAGGQHTCAVKTDGSVWCWGLNDNGQLGDNTTADSSFPVQVVGAGGAGVLSNVASVTAGLKHTCAVKTDNTVWCWGDNPNGQLGDNTTADSAFPVQVVGAGGVGTLTGVATVGADGEHSCAVKTDNTAWCWGLNDKGQLGDNTTADSSFPVQVVGVGGTGTLTDAVEVVAGLKHTCSARTGGTMVCWGDNPKGQLGDGTTAGSSVPVPVVGPGGVGTLDNVTVTGAGDSHTCAARTDDTVWCWGLNSDAQLGNNTKTDSTTPVQAFGV